MPDDLNFTADDIASIAADVTGKSPAPSEPAGATPEPTQASPTSAAPASAPAPEDVPYPTAWKKDYQTHWPQTPAEVRKYIAQREQEVGEGFKKYGAIAKQYEGFEQVYKPYEHLLQQANLTPQEAFKLLMHNHLALSYAPPEQKLQLLQRFVEHYKLGDLIAKLGGGAQPGAEGQPATPQIPPELVQRLSALEEQTRQSQLKALNEQVNAFAKANPYFDELADDIVRLIQKGAADNVEEAYKLALRANDAVFSKWQAEQTAAAQREAAAKVDASKGSNLKPSDTPPSSRGRKRSMDETIAETADALFRT